MKFVNKDKMISEFNLRYFGAKRWMHSESLPCPFCGKKDKFGVMFTESNRGVYHCFKCDKKGSIRSLLEKIGRQDLIVSNDDSNYEVRSEVDATLKFSDKKDEDISCEEIKVPLAFKPLEKDDYLDNRGWVSWQYHMYHAGTSLDPRLKNKIVFLLYEDGKVIGYLARSRYSKEWHKENLRKFKEGKASLCLRYDNSRATKFERVVGGIDEVEEGKTETVILVEGIMDKANTDKVLHLNESPSVKCCFTFGCKLSRAQMEKLYRKGIKTVILMYDPGTIQQVKSASIMLSKKFNIFISELKGDKDPGEMNIDDFENAFSHMFTPLQYYANRLQTIELK